MAFSDCLMTSFAGVPVLNILAFIGAATLTVFFAKSLYQLWRAVRLYVLPSPIKLTSYGKWAVVTGATDGIGKAYVEELARKGMNVLLISRSAGKLSSCIAELQESFPKVEFASLVVDFSGGAEIYDRVKEVTADLDIGVLINNVGIVTDYPMYLDETPTDVLWKLINVNISSMVFMTHTILPGMLRRGRGAIVNIASVAGTFTIPLNSTYSGCKACVDFFTRGLQAEYEGRGVLFQCTLPCAVATKLIKMTGKTSFFCPSPQAYARQALGTLGVSHRTPGYWTHSFQTAMAAAMPSFLMINFVRKMNTEIRAAVLRKRASRKAD